MRDRQSRPMDVPRRDDFAPIECGSKREHNDDGATNTGKEDVPRVGPRSSLTMIPHVSAEVTIVAYPCTAAIPTSRNTSHWWQAIIDDFDTTKGGDFKILRAIGRTATVNAAVALAAVTGGTATGLVGFATGGAITARRLGAGLEQQNAREVTKSLAVYGSATSASVVGQVVAGALMVGVAGASLPVAAAVAFGVGCGSGITAGAMSEWAVDSAFEKGNQFWSTFSDHIFRSLYKLALPVLKRKRGLRIGNHFVQVSKTDLTLYKDST